MFMNLPSLQDDRFWNLLGWTMWHYLWVGAIFSMAVMVLRILLRRSSPNLRYLAAVVSLVILALLTLSIGWRLAVETTVSSSPRFEPYPTPAVGKQPQSDRETVSTPHAEPELQPGLLPISDSVWGERESPHLPTEGTAGSAAPMAAMPSADFRTTRSMPASWLPSARWQAKRPTSSSSC